MNITRDCRINRCPATVCAGSYPYWWMIVTSSSLHCLPTAALLWPTLTLCSAATVPSDVGTPTLIRWVGTARWLHGQVHRMQQTSIVLSWLCNVMPEWCVKCGRALVSLSKDNNYCRHCTLCCLPWVVSVITAISPHSPTHPSVCLSVSLSVCLSRWQRQYSIIHVSIAPLFPGGVLYLV